MTKCLRVALILMLASGSRTFPRSGGVGRGERGGGEASELARALANPVANLWSLQFQFNNFQLTNDRWNYNLQLPAGHAAEPDQGLNLITRPVIQVYNSAPYQTSTGANARTTNFGDWTQLELLSPANTGHWLLGAGPTFIFPTGGSVYTGQGKFQVGPAVVVAYMTTKFIARRLPAAVVVLCRRPQPPGHEPVKPPAPSQFLLPRRLECGLLGKHPGRLARRRPTIAGPCPSAWAPEKSSSSAGCP